MWLAVDMLGQEGILEPLHRREVAMMLVIGSGEGGLTVAYRVEDQ